MGEARYGQQAQARGHEVAYQLAAAALALICSGRAASRFDECDDRKFDNKFEVPVMYSTAIPEPLL
jgi:hypothetical protein